MVFTRMLALGVQHLVGLVSGRPELARGWGHDIQWLTLDEAEQVSQQQHKPMMVIVHKLTCPVCARVKPLFAAHQGVHSLSQFFAMVNLEPNEVPREEEFEPDGAYVPRFLFFNPEIKVYKEIKGKEKGHQYFFDDMNLLQIRMMDVLKHYNTQV